jgi:hypothetical protein
MSQPSLLDVSGTRSLLDRLIGDSQLYKQSNNYKELLDFVARLPHIAPFNAMLLQIQKPGLRFAMTAKEWRKRFGRYPKEGARPLVIMWPFGPVAFVYDALDTDGLPLPRDAFMFEARGNISTSEMARLKDRLKANKTNWYEVDRGDGHAGLVRIVKRSENPKIPHEYRININRNHPPPTQFVTLAHELGHIYLGHLGADPKREIKNRSGRTQTQDELEAESVAYLVCARAGIETVSEPYLSDYVQNEKPLDEIDIYEVMKATATVESVLDLNPKAFRQPIVRST